MTHEDLLSAFHTAPNDLAFPWCEESGLSKREYFAAMAMQGIIAANHRYDELGFDTEMQQAVVYADALIEALNK